jgi:putative phage-type endonuclease
MENVEIIPVWDLTEDQWLTLREEGIGGSDAGTICGVNKYKSPYALWAEKSRLVGRDFAGDAAKWGHRLEPVVAAAYAEDHNKAIVSWPVLIRSTVHSFMFANVDNWIVEPSEQFPAGQVTEWRSSEAPEGILSILEIKTTGIASPGTAHQWKNDGIPESYQLQTVHYGVVTGVHSIVFAALLAGQGLVVREPEWDDDLAENLVAAEGQFWDLVTSGQPPAVDGTDATESALSEQYGRSEPGKEYDGGSALLIAWDEFQSAKAEAEAADKVRKEKRALILSMVGDAEIGLSNGTPLFTYKTGKDVESVDTARLKAEAPEVYANFLKTRPGARTLRKAPAGA